MTKIKQRCEETGLDTVAFSKAARLYTSETAKIVRGAYRCGARVRGRIASALGAPEADLFDADGWPLMAEEPQAVAR